MNIFNMYSSGKGLLKRRRTQNYAAAAAAIQKVYRGYMSRKRTAASARAALKTRTRTATRTAVIRKGTVEENGTGGQISKFYGPKYKCYIGPTMHATAPITYVKNDAFQKTSAVGQQNAFLAIEAGTHTDYASVSTNTKIYRYHLSKFIGEVDIYNAKLSNATITIYDIVYRRDIGNSLLTDAFAAWVRGDIDESASGSYLWPGQTPFATDCFNSFFKVLQVTDVTLGSGNQHRHKFSMEPNKLISGPLGYYGVGWKDCSYNCLVVFSGQPANDTVTQTSVTLGTAALNVVTRCEHHWKLLSNNQAFLLGTNSLSSTFANAEQVVNEGGSLISANALG